MMCPFLGKPCKSCAVYIGRHYYLCYSETYRGRIGRKQAAGKFLTQHAVGAKPKKNFKIPIVKVREGLDPFDTDLQIKIRMEG
jgi:hypothetical protein